jgi:CcmD family protein
MGKEAYLFAANIAVWLGIGLYVAFLAGAQKRLERRIKRLEVLGDDQ